MSNRNYINSFVWAFPLSLILWGISITLSKDQANYRYFFEIAQESSWNELRAYSSDLGIEYLYFILNKIWFFGYESFAYVLIYVAISTKLIFFNSIQKIYKINQWYVILFYLSLIGLVNDAAQMRIALASGVFMLSLVCYLNDSRFRYYFLMLLSIFLHSSMSILVLAFVTYKYFNFLYRPLVFSLFFLLMNFFLKNYIDTQIGIFLEDSRYAYYIGIGADSQNSTGLYQYFFVAMILVIFLHSMLGGDIMPRLRTGAHLSAVRLEKFCRCCGFLSIYALLLFSQSVAMSMRFSELFLIFFSITIVTDLNKYIKSKILFSTCYISIILVIAAARFYHTHIYLNTILD
jgi:EpsG family